MGEVHIEICPGCEGVFLDGGELAVLRTRMRTPAERRLAARRMQRRRRLREERDAFRLTPADMIWFLVRLFLRRVI